jgi:hypothetical protein
MGASIRRLEKLVRSVRARNRRIHGARWDSFTGFELAEMEIALAHRLDEGHAYVWCQDALRLHDEIADILEHERFPRDEYERMYGPIPGAGE